MPLQVKEKLSLSADSPEKRVIELNLTLEVIKLLQKAQSDGKNLSVKFNPSKQTSLVIHAGEDKYECISENKPASALYKVYQQLSPAGLELVGEITSEATLKKLQEEKKFQAAREKMRKKQIAINQQKEKKRVIRLDEEPIKAGSNKSTTTSRAATLTKPAATSKMNTTNNNSSSIKTSTRATRSTNSIMSSSSTTKGGVTGNNAKVAKATVKSNATRKPGPTLVQSSKSSASETQGSTSQSNQVLIEEESGGIPLKTRIIQLLAWTDLPFDKVVRMTQDNKDQVLAVLKMVAQQVGQDWRLKDETYKEVKVYEWTSYANAEIKAVVDRATKAFNALKIPKDAPEWKKLRQPMETKRKRPAPSSIATLPVSSSRNEPPEMPATKKRKTAQAAAPSTSTIAITSVTTRSPRARKTARKPEPVVKKSPAPLTASSSTQAKKPAVRKTKSQSGAEDIPNVISPSSTSTANASGSRKSISPSSASTSTSTSNNGAEFTLARVTSLKQFRDLETLFRSKYERYEQLFNQLKDDHKTNERLNAEYSNCKDPEEKAQITRKIAAQFGDTGEVSLKMREYTTIQDQLRAIKTELYRASEEETLGATDMDVDRDDRVDDDETEM
ncbi:10028_t:CDS:2 [Ambispora gerdemannii]|uniref:10028_t:CDS:1 n=1 Tax=Ambispora gerdemannii TaxID=144530 RepID=A0A9N9GID7_9GLOM|nr:10028_t:CDS:2 [Ambispora gerdemannii]